MDTDKTSPFTMLVFSARKPGMSFEAYKSHYETTHAPLVRRLVLDKPGGPLSFTRHYIQRDGSGASGESSPSFPFGGGEGWEYDCVTRTEWKDEETYRANIKLFEENLKEIQEDEEMFLDRSKLRIVLVGHCPSYVRKVSE